MEAKTARFCSLPGPIFSFMNTIEHARLCAAEQGASEEEALKPGYGVQVERVCETGCEDLREGVID